MRLVDEYQAATTREYINWDPSSMGGASAKVSSSCQLLSCCFFFFGKVRVMVSVMCYL